MYVCVCFYVFYVYMCVSMCVIYIHIMCSSDLIKQCALACGSRVSHNE